jgi:hypothetical protein
VWDINAMTAELGDVASEMRDGKVSCTEQQSAAVETIAGVLPLIAYALWVALDNKEIVVRAVDGGRALDFSVLDDGGFLIRRARQP